MDVIGILSSARRLVLAQQPQRTAIAAGVTVVGISAALLRRRLAARPRVSDLEARRLGLLNKDAALTST